MSVSVERLGDAQVLELALAAAQPAADPAQRVGRAERAEQHGDELPPVREPARMALGVRPLDQGLELRLRKQLEELAEPAAKSTRTLGSVAGRAGVPRVSIPVAAHACAFGLSFIAVRGDELGLLRWLDAAALGPR